MVRWAPGVHVLGWWRMEGLGVPLGYCLACGSRPWQCQGPAQRFEGGEHGGMRGACAVPVPVTDVSGVVLHGRLAQRLSR